MALWSVVKRLTRFHRLCRLTIVLAALGASFACATQTRGVVPTVRVISTAGAPLVLTTPLVEVMVPLLSVASKPR